MTGSHVEVETKLVPPVDEPGWSLPLATLKHLAGVHTVLTSPPVTLVARYHDTAELALLRARLTLRRREGGADEAGISSSRPPARVAWSCTSRSRAPTTRSPRLCWA